MIIDTKEDAICENDLNGNFGLFLSFVNDQSNYQEILKNDCP